VYGVSFSLILLLVDVGDIYILLKINLRKTYRFITTFKVSRA